MVGSFVRLAAAAAFCALLAGCASAPSSSYDDADVTAPDTPLQCVPYARDHSQIALYGDAYTWWDQAAGRFARGASPRPGAVMVLNNYAGPNRAHVAVVREIVDARDIRIDHANWLDDGAIYVNDPVVDVSESNDWTAVRVWNIRTGTWGTRIYRVQGFIGPGPAGNPVVAANNRSLANDPIARQIAAADTDSDGSDDER
jgi:surface antigen